MSMLVRHHIVDGCQQTDAVVKRWCGTLQVSMSQPHEAQQAEAATELSTTEAGSLLLRAGQKRFFFDAFCNPHGSFFRITEVCYGLLICSPAQNKLDIGCREYQGALFASG